MIKFDFNTYTNRFIDKDKYNLLINQKKEYIDKLYKSDMTGWMKKIEKEIIEDIEKTAKYIKDNYDTLVVIGIGGSFLGSFSFLKLFEPYFNKNFLEIIYAGTTLSSKYLDELLGYLEGVKGVKTGFTNNAGRCLVTCTNRNGFETITVVLGADTKKFRTQDSIKLIEYTYKNFKEIDITETITSKFLEWKRINQNKIIIEKAKKNSRLELIFNDIKNNCIPIKTTDLDKIEIEIYCLTYLKAPIKENSILGNMKIMLNGEVIEMVDIINKEKIEKKNEIDYFLEFLDLIA